MIKVDLRADMSVALRAVDGLADGIKGPAVSRALNRAATTVRSQANRRIRERYGMKASDVNRELGFRRASPARLEAVVYARGRRIALARFAARQTKRGVSVKVLRSAPRKQVQGNPAFSGQPFMAKLKTGHVGVFQRVGKARLPIKELFSIGVPNALTQREIALALRDVASDRFRTELAREIQFRLARGR